MEKTLGYWNRARRASFVFRWGMESIQDSTSGLRGRATRVWLVGPRGGNVRPPVSLARRPPCPFDVCVSTRSIATHTAITTSNCLHDARSMCAWAQLTRMPAARLREKQWKFVCFYIRMTHANIRKLIYLFVWCVALLFGLFSHHCWVVARVCEVHTARCVVVCGMTRLRVCSGELVPAAPRQRPVYLYRFYNEMPRWTQTTCVLH
jgi:hypothetical protein